MIHKIKKDIYQKIIKIHGKGKLEVNEPPYHKSFIKFLNKAAREKELSSIGKYTAQFEKKITNYCKSKYCFATNSGTSALHLVLKSLGIGLNDEVLVPSLTFAGTVNSISYCNANPHFIDSNIKSNFGIDVEKLDNYLEKNFFFDKKKRLKNKVNKNTVKAIISVHVYGFSSNIFKLKKIAKKYRLYLIEDAAGAFGSKINNKYLGTFADAGIYSFNGNKIITTGGGGAVVTNNKSLFNKIYKLGTTSKKRHPYKYLHDKIGYNYRMPSINAALGLAQLKVLSKILNKKQLLHKLYLKEFKELKYAKIYKSRNVRDNNWINILIFSDKLKKNTDQVIKFLHQKKIKVKPVWKLMSTLNHFKKYPKMNLDGSNEIYNKTILLPSSVKLNLSNTN